MVLKLIRIILGKVILTLDRLFSPTPRLRSPADQAEVDQATASLILYQYEACPFCVKVRRAIRGLGLKIELRDAKQKAVAEELVAGGGELQVPCLRIPQAGAAPRWLYESDAIIVYLESLA
jgi:glutaredoxin